jgi:hypothetical protein
LRVRNQITFASLTGAAAILVALVPSASARVQYDPCHGDAGYDSAGFVCQGVEQIPGATTARVPQGRGLECKPDFKMVHTPVTPHDVGFNQFTASWDFWADRGEWVTWSGVGEFRTAGTGNGDKVATAYYPELHNWWAGAWTVRAYHVCDRYRNGARAETASSDPGPAGDVDVAGDGQDTERGGHGVDEILGGHGADQLHGGGGADQLLSGPGDDVDHGGAGSDELFDDQGIDHLDGGPGNDRFSAMDGDADEIVCGGGEDVVVADPIDSTHGCEHVYTSAATAPAEPPRN